MPLAELQFRPRSNPVPLPVPWHRLAPAAGVRRWLRPWPQWPAQALRSSADAGLRLVRRAAFPFPVSQDKDDTTGTSDKWAEEPAATTASRRAGSKNSPARPRLLRPCSTETTIDNNWSTLL